MTREKKTPEEDSGIFSIGVALDRMKELLPLYEKCDGFGCTLTPNGILHDFDCSQKEAVQS